LSKDSEAEQIFRQNYAQELKKKRLDELEDERKKVKQQGMKTPGRRGEEIKHEEIDKEIVRRYSLSQKKS
jgi:predicted N-acyltransferase